MVGASSESNSKANIGKLLIDKISITETRSQYVSDPYAENYELTQRYQSCKTSIITLTPKVGLLYNLFIALIIVEVYLSANKNQSSFV
eukprot:snap_masked-scaffold_7-processed-gene-13.20-mRNA-1 protein AED:1.00 eAED:1.00 QI:0/-1/0/0/-1/1/1/0/87